MNELKNAHIENTEGDINISQIRNEWQKENLSENTQALLAEDAKYFLHQSLSTPCLNAVEDCDDCYIIDKDGRHIMDFHGNSVHQVGYKNPAVIKAAKEHLDKLPFSPRRYTNGVAVEFAKKLIEISPEELTRILFAPGGTEAIGIALKLARIKTKRFKTVSWWDSFHGASLDAISIGGEALFRKDIGPLLPGAIHITPPGALGFTEEQLLEYAEYVFKREGDISAFIAEPIRCTSVIIPSREYWEGIRYLCDKYKALLIFDEIPICLGRTGYMFACEYYGITPDILCIGKGLGGGIFPMSAVLAKEELNIAGHISIGHYTHEKSPLGSAIGLAVINEIDQNDLVNNSKRLGGLALEILRDMKKQFDFIHDVRGQGLLFGIELNSTELAEKVLYASLTKGLSFKISDGKFITLSPPLTITEELLRRALYILREAIQESF
jgi:4-aminobutyrate aminotransferase